MYDQFWGTMRPLEDQTVLQPIPQEGIDRLRSELREWDRRMEADVTFASIGYRARWFRVLLGTALAAIEAGRCACFTMGGDEPPIFYLAVRSGEAWAATTIEMSGGTRGETP